jgi:hypothetical protein
MTASEWIVAFCREIGLPAPTEEQSEAILRLASVAAHSSERVAAPIACWAAGVSGRPLGELVDTAERVGGGG